MSEMKGRCYVDMKASRDLPNDHFVLADAIDRLAADVEAIKAKVDAVSPEDVKHFVDSEKAWVALVTEQRDAAIRERDEWKEEARLAVVNRDEARAEVERHRMTTQERWASMDAIAHCEDITYGGPWRPVTEDAPDTFDTVLGWAGGYPVIVRRVIEDGEDCWEYEDNQIGQFGWITHWMALPEPPAAVLRPAAARPTGKVVEVPPTCPSVYGFDSPFSNWQYKAGYREACLMHRAALDKAGVKWKEVPRE